MLWFIFSILLLILIWDVFVFEPYHIIVKKKIFCFKNLPESLKKTKIVHLSDIHSKKFGRKERIVLKIIDKLNPNYIFISGDIVEISTKSKRLKDCQKFWQALAQKHHGRVYSVLGDNAHHKKRVNVHVLTQTLKECGIDVLINENRKLKINNEDIYLIGVDDPHTDHDDFSKAIQGVGDSPARHWPESKAMAGGPVKILLAHSSEIIEQIKPGDVDLILVGHTHGGQVKFPFIRAFWIPTKYHGKYTRGLFKVKFTPLETSNNKASFSVVPISDTIVESLMGSTYLYVNPGIGAVILPIRFNCLPEITLIELKNKCVNGF